jgi:hypothetical protein
MFTDYFENLATPASEANMYDLVAEEERKKFVCKQPGCGKIFRYKSEIERHIATHSESRPFICQYDNCFKAFKRSDALENHIRSSHTKETPFACPFPDCGMKFTTHGSFRYHVLKHNKNGEGEIAVPTQEVVSTPAQPRKQVKMVSPPEISTSFNQPLKRDPMFEKLGHEDLGDDFYVPAPRFASSIQWQMVNDDTECSSPTQQTEESQADRLNNVVEENKMLKEKLTTSEKIIKSMQKQINDLLGSLFAYQSQTIPTEAFPDFLGRQNNATQENYMENTSRPEEPSLEMINYADEMNLPSPLDTKFMRESSAIDAFLSFGNAFDF